VYHLLRVIPRPKRVQTSSKEGSILLAMSAFQSGQCASAFAAAKAYKVKRKTLYRRINGGTSREDYTPSSKRLSYIEEEVIVKNILELDAQGLSPTTRLVKEMADAICKPRGVPPVGVKWANTFIKRTPSLEVKLGRTYECQRRLCEDPKVIGAWFELVRNTINKYGSCQRTSTTLMKLASKWARSLLQWLLQIQANQEGQSRSNQPIHNGSH